MVNKLPDKVVVVPIPGEIPTVDLLPECKCLVNLLPRVADILVPCVDPNVIALWTQEEFGQRPHMAAPVVQKVVRQAFWSRNGCSVCNNYNY